MLKFIPGALFVATLALTAACSSGTTTVVPTESTTQSESEEASQVELPSDAETEAPSEDASEPSMDSEASGQDNFGSRSEPLTQGDTVVIDDGMGGVWEVSVGPAILDANALVAEENMFNDEPPEGFQYALLPVQATYLGEETGSPAWDLDFAFVSSSGTTHKEFDVTVVGPDELSNSNELYSGGVAEGNIVIAVPSEDIENGTWRISTSWGEQDIFFQAQ